MKKSFSAVAALLVVMALCFSVPAQADIIKSDIINSNTTVVNNTYITAEDVKRWSGEAGIGINLVKFSDWLLIEGEVFKDVIDTNREEGYTGRIMIRLFSDGALLDFTK